MSAPWEEKMNIMLWRIAFTQNAGRPRGGAMGPRRIRMNPKMAIAEMRLLSQRKVNGSIWASPTLIEGKLSPQRNVTAPIRR